MMRQARRARLMRPDLLARMESTSFDSCDRCAKISMVVSVLLT